MRFVNISVLKRKSALWLGLAVILLAAGLFAFLTRPSANEQETEPSSSQTSSQVGKVIVEEYLSLTCPHCATFHAEIYSKLAKGVLQNEHVVFVYRDFPLDRLALQAAALARCSGEELGSEELRAKLRAKIMGAMLERQRKWLKNEQPQRELFAIVALVGIDRARAQACLEDEALERAVLEEQIAGRKRYKISSTPTIVVDGKKLSGALSVKSITRAIQESLDAQGL